MSERSVFRLPDLGEGLTEAEIVQWLVAEGDEVTIDQEVVTVETAKAAVDVPCPYAGTVTSLHGAAGQTLAVGSPLITITPTPTTPSRPDTSAGGETPSPDTSAGGETPSPDTSAGLNGAGGEQYRAEERAGGAPERPLIGYGAGDGPARRTRSRRRSGVATSEPTPEAAAPTPAAAQAVKVISPLVRRLAAEARLDLASITPSGPAGVVLRADVEAALATGSTGAALTQPSALAAPRPIPAGDTRTPITGAHKLMVQRLTTSRREIPDATTWVDVDATGLVETKDALKRARPDDGIGVLALMARIVVAGLRKYPALNSSVDLAAGEIVQHGAVNLGFAAQSPRGLVVPVVHDAGSMTTAELAAALRDLTALARDGKLSPAQLTGGTMTLNNYGVFGVDGSTPIINHPEAAMLGVGRIVDKPWVVDGALAVRKVTQLSFTFDHRVCDGGTAGGFLRYVADCVEAPAVLLGDA